MSDIGRFRGPEHGCCECCCDRDEYAASTEAAEAEVDRLAAENAALCKRLLEACDHLRETHGRHGLATSLASGNARERATRRVLIAVQAVEARLAQLQSKAGSPEMQHWAREEGNFLAAYRALKDNDGG